MKKIFFALLLSISALVSVTALAHHSFSATFKTDFKITVQGSVTKYSFKNPHVLVYFDVQNPDGTVTEWISEGAAATNMRRRGWNADTFKAGDIISVTGDSTHDGSPMTTIDRINVLDEAGAVLRQLSEEGEVGVEGDEPAGGMGGMGGMGRRDGGQGQEIFVKAVPIDLTLANGKPNLTGTWTRHGMGLGRPQTPTVRFNAEGQKAQALFTEAVDPQVFCDAPGLIRQAGMTPHPVRLTQFDDRVEFQWEEYGGSRTIYFDDRDVKGYKTHLGDSVARYENDALIIETNNLLSNPSSPEGHITSDQTTVTEIYTRQDSDKFGSVLRIRMTAKDPNWVDGELTFDGLKMLAGEYEFIENDCQTPLRERVAVHASTSFFITSVGLGDGANLGGLAGADAHCEALASEMNIGGKDWRAYLSTTGEDSVNARDRIGNGPWYNASGEVVATSVDNLHSDNNMLTKASGLSERAGAIPTRGDEVNKHDILTGATIDGLASTAEGETTCGNWTSNSEDGAALAGHYDRAGGGQNPTSWNQAHSTKGCSQQNLQATGGDGLFYCFASIENTTNIDVDNIIPIVGYLGPQSSNPVAPTVQAQAAPPSAQATPASTEVAERRNGLSSFIVPGIIALLLVIGVFVFRGKGS